MNDIREFRGSNYYLSNFHMCPVTYKGLTFTNTEAAFHSQKCAYRAHEFTDLDPSQAKRLGRRVHLREDWEEVKDHIMYEVCMAKFTQHPILKEKLLATGNCYLEEGNTWNDTYWGVCKGIGKNKLGHILMKIRQELRNG